MTIIVPKGQEQMQAPVQPQPPAAETAAVAEKPAVSPQLLKMAQEQKAIRRRQLEAKAREEELAAREAKIAAMEQDYKTNYIPKSRFKEDAIGALNETGLSYDAIVQAQLSQDPVAQAMKPLEAKLIALEEQHKKATEDAKVQQQKAYDQAVNQVRNEVKLLIDADPNYETIKANDAQESVVELIKETFEKDGKLLTVEEASMQIEDWLLEQAVKMAQLEKVKKRLAPAETIPEVPLAKALAQQSKQPKTLTNAATTAPRKPLSAKERIERAKLAFRGQLPPS